MKRKVLVALLCSLGTAGLSTQAGAATAHGRLVRVPRYKIAFYAPASWKHATVTTATSGSTKVLVQDTPTPGKVDLIQVQAITGRHTNAADIADGLSEGLPGVQIVGSKIATFTFGKAEELRFSAVVSGVPVDGIAEAFYLDKRTYIVAFDSTQAALPYSVVRSVLNSWGA